MRVSIWLVVALALAGLALVLLLGQALLNPAQPLITDAGFSHERITPNADGSDDIAVFSYSLSRNALWWATQTLAQALAPAIRVNGVGPGPTLPSVHQTPAEFAAEAGATLLQRPGSPEAVAAAVRWLLDADMVTGQMIAVDGGQHLAWRTPDILE